ncbi:MAG: PhnD/SsuA/transferrin family substrate-binding protein, partial [Wenzhouxiangellaceae bacterium]
MSRHLRHLILPLTCALCLLAAAGLHAQNPTQHSSDVLVLGRISDDPAAHYDRLRPLLDHVVSQMGDLGIREGRVLMTRDASAMVSYLRQGRVDWVTETAGAALTLIDRGGAQPLALSWRGGAQRYYSVFVARRDSGITSL